MRSQRGVVWPYLVLSLALLSAMSFGWYQTKQKNQLVLDSENKYMSAFHRLKWNSENIEERTAKLMATNDPQVQAALLADLRVFSAQSVDAMSVLPFATMNIPHVESFLNTLRMKSDEMYNKLAMGGKLADEDWKQLMEMRKQSVTFEKELSDVLGLVGRGRIRWASTVRATSPTQKKATSTPITSSVVQMERLLTAPQGAGAETAPAGGPLKRPRLDPGPRVEWPVAAEAIKRFVDTGLQGEPQFAGSSEKTDEGKSFPLYFFKAQKTNGTPLDFGVSVHGGHVIYMIDGRPVREKRFTQDQLAAKARQMLTNWGYPATEFLSAIENDGTMVLDLAPVEQGVAIHVDVLKVMLAMDNGELVGFDARNYWINRHPRQIAKPKLNAAAASARVAPGLTQEGMPRLVLIADRLMAERLVWEVRGQTDGQRFRIFIDAESGHEVEVERVQGDPAPPLDGRQRSPGA